MRCVIRVQNMCCVPHLDPVLALAQGSVGHGGSALVFYGLEAPGERDVPGLHLGRELLVLHHLLHLMRNPELVRRDVSGGRRGVSIGRRAGN